MLREQSTEKICRYNNFLKLTFTEGDDEPQQLPPEMFVPNQQRWLELRARSRNRFVKFILCSDTEAF